METVGTVDKKLFFTVSWKLWKIKIGWDYLFVKADQYFDHVF